MNEADTCRTLVRPRLEAAGWDTPPRAYSEQTPFTDGRIIVPAGKPRRLKKKFSDVIEMLEEKGIDFNELAATAGNPEADPFDLLCHLAYNAPLLTRKQRAEKLRKDRKDFFDQFGPEARAIINALLDKYADHGAAQLSIPDVFEVPPISLHGNLTEIAAKFGGTDKLVEAFGRLQEYLYAA